MDTKLRNSDDNMENELTIIKENIDDKKAENSHNFEELKFGGNKDINPPSSENMSFGKKAFRVLVSSYMRIGAVLVAFVCMVVLLHSAYAIAENNSGIYDIILPNDSDYQTSWQYTQDRQNLYQALCMLGTMYYRNVDGNGAFNGSDYLLKSLARKIGDYSTDETLKVFMRNGKPVIESETFNYYVCFEENGDKAVLTNIDGYKNHVLTDNDISDIKNTTTSWYVRKDNLVTIDKENINTSNSYEYSIYSYYDEYFGATDANEYYPDYSVPTGFSGKDSLGRYICCYGPFSDTILYDFNTYDKDKTDIVKGYARKEITEDEFYDDTYEDIADYYEDEDVDGKLRYYASIKIEHATENYQYTPFDDSDITVVIYPNQEKLAAIQDNYSNSVAVGKVMAKRMLVTGSIFIVMALYLLTVCGYRLAANEKSKKWKRSFIFGRWYVEILVTAGMGLLMLFILTVHDYRDMSSLLHSIDVFSPYDMFWLSTFAAAQVILLLGLVCGLLSKFKAKTFIRDFIIFKAISAFIKRCKKTARKSGLFAKYAKNTLVKRLYIRQWIFYALTALWGITNVMCSLDQDVLILTSIVYIPYVVWHVIVECWYFKDMDKIDTQIDKVCRGEEIECEVSESSLMYQNNIKLMNLSQGVKEAVEQQIQSERMKIELVTNVSHDLKTPLTSIISYIDLLKSEEMSDEAKDYVKILEQKSEKLKNIVSDVFSLAKATSGVDIDLERLDAVILLNQVIADISDKIEASGKQVKVSVDSDCAMIMADGNKLYRVFQNLIDNALNYSLDGTRIFVDMTSELTSVKFTVKNTSSYEMDFTPDEIMERFVRGDKSRTDGGNGLGLSIAKTFTEACGGRFDLEIDGDVFKAVVKLNKVD